MDFEAALQRKTKELFHFMIGVMAIRLQTCVSDLFPSRVAKQERVAFHNLTD